MLRATAQSGSGWGHEIKFDGYRIQARLDHGEVSLLTRKGIDWSEKFPNIAAAVAKLPARTALIDGEVVVEEENGVSSFSALQAALKAGERERFTYYVFDLLHIDGRDLTALPLIERKAELARLVEKAQRGPIKYSEHFEDEGSAVLRPTAAVGRTSSSRRNARTPRSWWSAAMRRRRCGRERSARWLSGIMIMASSSMRAASVPAIRSRWRRICGSGCIPSRSTRPHR